MDNHRSRAGAWLQLASVLILSPFFIFPSVERMWVFAAAVGVIVFKAVSQRKFIERTALDWPILFLLHQVFWSALRTSDWSLSLPKIAGIVFAVWVFYAVVEFIDTPNLIRKSVYIFLALSVTFAVGGLLGMKISEGSYVSKNIRPIFLVYKLLPKINFNLPGAEDGFNPNAVGGTLAFFLPAVFAFLMYAVRRRKVPFFRKMAVVACLGVVFMIEFGILIVTASRGSMLAVVLSLLIIAGMFFFSPNKHFLMIVSLTACFILLLAVCYFSLFGHSNREDVRNELFGQYMGREQAWTLAVDTIREHPLVGVGMNHIRIHPGIGYKRSHALNMMLHTAAELGIPGLVAYLAILLSVAAMCREVWRKSRNAFIKTAVLGLGGGQLAYFIFGISDAIPLGTKPGIVFWISTAIIAASYKHLITEESNSQCAISKNVPLPSVDHA